MAHTKLALTVFLSATLAAPVLFKSNDVAAQSVVQGHGQSAAMAAKRARIIAKSGSIAAEKGDVDLGGENLKQDCKLELAEVQTDRSGRRPRGDVDVFINGPVIQVCR